MTDIKKLGFDWSKEIVQVADSLYHSQVPKLWCILSGNQKEMIFYSLSSFFNDLIVRYNHIDKCLTVVSFLCKSSC
jgi:hypothetical protein